MSNNYSAIPTELKQLRQWIVWRYEDIGAKKPTKVPYDAKTGKYASTDDINTWSDFDTVVSVAHNYSGIGFIFTENDPYSFIDLDDTSKLPNGELNPNKDADLTRQIKIYQEFNSYSEVSPSGVGLHIIVKGNISAGRKRSFIEIYSDKRYATFTGNVYNDKPIADRQELLTQLWEQMGAGPVAINIYKGAEVETLTDNQIVNQARNAVNGEKFSALFDGNWQSLYPSQSEADFALIDILAFYTQNINQIMRLFQSSLLGKRDKAKRSSYILSMINRSFDRMLPPIDFDGFKNQLELELVAANKKTRKPKLVPPTPQQQIASEFALEATNPQTSYVNDLPPGLLGEVAQYIYAAAPRPVPEIALAASIGLLAGICGRAYNTSTGAGLNQYVLIIANTGAGKEGAQSGISALMEAIKLQVPTSTDFIGPGRIASGQALVKHMATKSQCFLSILPEFGHTIQRLSGPHVNSADITLRQMFLELYSKSGFGHVMQSSIYADQDKNVSPIFAPSFSILGESTPEKFYSSLDDDMISEGLLPRFMLIEYSGPRVSLNAASNNIRPSFSLTERLAALTAMCESIMHNKRVINVGETIEAKQLLDRFDEYSTSQINEAHKDTQRQLWNRAHLKALKISSLIAVGVNMADPVIEASYAKWAIGMVQSDIKMLSGKFERGEIGLNSSEIMQQNEIKRIIKEYITKNWTEMGKYSDNQKLHDEKIIPYSYISRRLISNAIFRHDKIGGTNAIKRTLQILTDSDKIREVPTQDLRVRFGTYQKAYVISNVKFVLDALSSFRTFPLTNWSRPP